MELLREGGMRPLEDFPGKPGRYWLTECLTCGTAAHYRLTYVIEKTGTENACRACFWKRWVDGQTWLPAREVSRQEVEAAATRGQYDYLGPCFPEPRADYPHRVRCQSCKVIFVRRSSEVGANCPTCRANPRRDAPDSTRRLFRDSGLPIVNWWDHERNSERDWMTAPVTARRLVHWRCPEGHRFTESPASLTWCPECESASREKYLQAMQELEGKAIADVPHLLARWDDPTDPRVVLVGTGEYHRFRCVEGHRSTRRPSALALEFSCPSCLGAETRALAEEPDEPERPYRLSDELASQFHPTRNAKIKLATLSPRSRRQVWWRDEVCGHEFAATPRDRELLPRWRCPECQTVLDSLGWHYSDIAAEWSDDNPTTAWHVRPTGRTVWGVPTWVCAQGHTWEASTASRVNGSLCPECRVTGKSRVELAHFEEMSARFESVRSGPIIKDPAFTRGTGWRPDIVIEDAGLRVVVEYDGSYWHAGKADTDRAKTLDLLAAGYLVVRLREHPLPGLEVPSDRYLEITVYSESPDPAGVTDAVEAWLRDR